VAFQFSQSTLLIIISVVALNLRRGACWILLLDYVSCYQQGSSEGRGCPGTALDSGIDAMEQRIDAAVSGALDGMTLRDLTTLAKEPDTSKTEAAEDQPAPNSSRTGL